MGGGIKECQRGGLIAGRLSKAYLFHIMTIILQTLKLRQREVI